jgi:ribonuclease VapC
MTVVFDASALLALLRDEAGAEAVAREIGDGMISAVNFQEVVKELLRRGVPADVAIEMLDALHLDVRPHGREEAIAAAGLFHAVQPFGCGLGDRTCMALAIAQNLPALTADRVWAEIAAPGLKVRLIR